MRLKREFNCFLKTVKIIDLLGLGTNIEAVRKKKIIVAEINIENIVRNLVFISIQICDNGAILEEIFKRDKYLYKYN